MFRHQIAIDSADIDHMGHVNNAVYLKWVQESVVAYWEKVAPAEAVAAPFETVRSRLRLAKATLRETLKGAA